MTIHTYDGPALLGRLRCTLFAMAATVLPFAPVASAAIVQVSVLEHLTASAASDNFNGTSFDQSSPAFNTNLSFDLYNPGYQSSATWSAGKATWSDSLNSISYADNAHQTVSPTPSFTNYQSDAQMHSGFIDKFQVTQPASLTLTATEPGGLVGTLWDNNIQVYSWNASSTSGPIPVLAGDNLRVEYSAVYQTLGGFRDYHGSPTYSADYGSSFRVDAAPVPEPSSVVALGLSCILVLRYRKPRWSL